MLQKGTAAKIILFACDSSTAPLTGLAIAAKVSKDGGPLAPAAGALTEVGEGFYALQLTAAEMDADLILVTASAPGAIIDPVELRTEPNLTAARAANLDRLDVTVSSRFAVGQVTVDDLSDRINSVEDRVLELPKLAQIEGSALLAKEASVGRVETALTVLDADITAARAELAAVPTDPLLAGDARLQNLDAPVSGVQATLEAVQQQLAFLPPVGGAPGGVPPAPESATPVPEVLAAQLVPAIISAEQEE